MNSKAQIHFPSPKPALASRLCNPAIYSLAAGLAVGLVAWLIWHRPQYLIAVLPTPLTPYAIFFANLFPLAVLIAAPGATALAKNPWQKVRISLLTAVLLAVSLIGTVRLLSGPPAETTATEYFPDGTCRQTSADTCSAAACVTLLKQYGIDTTEQKIAHLALTKANRGTHPLGIYRALQIAVDQTTNPLIVTYKSIDASALLNSHQPALVNVGLLHQPTTPLENDLVQKYQWTPGVVHSVVYLGIEEEKVKIADPDFGIEKWSKEGFLALYRGSAFTLN